MFNWYVSRSFPILILYSYAGTWPKEKRDDMVNPKPGDSSPYDCYLKGGLLHAFGMVPRSGLFTKQQLEHSPKASGPRLVVKSGMSTDVTLGWFNGLESFVRFFPEYGIEEVRSIEASILPYNKDDVDALFSEDGDSGAIILGRDGRIVALLTGGTGKNSLGRHDITYATPYCVLEADIKKAHPGIHLYPTSTDVHI